MSALDYPVSASSGGGGLRLVVPSASGGTLRASIGLPPMIPRDQVYYWTSVWQADIHRSRDELAAGEYTEFANGIDAARWLLRDE